MNSHAFKAQRELIDLMESIINNFLDDDDRYIVYNEVILGKTGSWYYEMLTVSTYYRHRRKAYNNFLTCLAK